MGPLFFFFFFSLAVFLWVVCIFRLQTPGADAVVLQVSCWSLGVIPEVSHLKFRGPSERCCVWHLALLAPSSADSKGQQKHGPWSSVQKPWGCSVLFHLFYFPQKVGRCTLKSSLPCFQTSNCLQLGSCWSSAQNVIFKCWYEL